MYDGLASVMSWAEDRPDLLYRPGPTIAAFLESDYKRQLLRAPNQIGKTRAGAIKAIRRSLAWDGQGPGLLGVMVADLENLFPTICKKIAEVMPRSLLDPSCKHIDGKGYYVHGRRGVRFANGVHWEFRGGEGAEISVAGGTVDLGWWIDEIPRRSHFNEAVRSTNRWDAPIWVTLTPISRPVQWFRSRVEGVDGKPPDDINPDGSPRWMQWVPELSTVECPWMSQERINQIIADTDIDERPQRLHGAWEGPTSDRLLSGMSSAAVVDEAPNGGRWRVTVAADHGELAGHEWVVVLLSQGSSVVVAAEYVNATATTPEDDARGIEAMLKSIGCPIARVDRWIGDTNSTGKRGAGRKVNDDLGAALSVLGRCSVRFAKPDKSSGSVDYGTRLLNVALHRGHLSVLSTCRKTIAAMWHHREDGDDHTHAIDTLRYGVVDLLAKHAEYASLDWRRG